nr:retrovirus-related Pol polyprotein from transposon TNT 1-94 [Tanacetum cinerariifolium]
MNESDLNDIHVNESEVLNNVVDSHESNGDDNQVNDRFKKGEGYHAVPSPYTWNYMPPRADLLFAGLDNSIFKSKVSEAITSVPKIETNTSKTNSEDENVFNLKEVKKTVKPSLEKIEFVNARNTTVKNENKAEKPRKFSQSPRGKITGQKEIRPVWDNTASVNHQNKLTHPHPKRNFVLAAVLTKSGQVPINAAKQRSHRAATSVSAAKHVNTAASRPNMNNALPTTYSYFKAHSLVKNVTTAGKKAIVNTVEGNQNNAVKSSTCWIWRPKGNLRDHISKDSGSYTLKRFNYVDSQGKLKSDQGIFDSGCSRYMTGNKSYIIDYQEINGEVVAFRGNAKGGKITGKGETLQEVCLQRFLKMTIHVLLVKRESNTKPPGIRLGLLSKNGVAERKNTTLIEAARTMLADSKLPTTFWVEAVNTACYVQNGVLVIKPHNKTPYELFLGRKPPLSFMRPFGCPVTILNTLDHLGLKSSETKVADDAGKKITQVLRKKNGVQDPTKEGEAANTKSTNRLNTVSSPVHTVSLPVNAVSSSFTTVDPGRERAQRNEFESMFGQDKDANGNKMFTLISAARSTYDTRIFSSAYDDEVEGAMADFNNLELTIVVNLVPTTRIYKDHPKEQIIGDPLLASQTRRMTKTSQEHAMASMPLEHNGSIETRKMRGIVVRNKARLVAQGYTQEEGIEYDKVFAPVAKIEAIRLFLAYASFMGFIVYQMDVKSAFLYGTIEEEVYVYQPPGFEDSHFSDKIYKVEKALYGLHQAPRAWYETLSTYLLENRFRRGIIDKTLFIKKDKDDILLVQVYVDDIIFGPTKKSLCTEFKGFMHKKFQMSFTGELTFFLGLQVMQRDNGIFISQDKYVADILKKFDFSSVRTISTPIETNKELLKDEESKDMDSPFDLEVFSDSDYAGASLDSKSTTGGCQFLRKRLISWQCKKQIVVSNSTTEAKYVAAANCCGQVLRIHN